MRGSIRDAAIWFLASASGAFVGSIAALTWVSPIADGWEAVSAVATSAAVVMALVPVWGATIQRSRQARTLRIQLVEDLRCLALMMKQRTGEAGPLTPEEANLCRNVEAVASRIHLLADDEILAANLVLREVRMASAIGLATDNSAEMVRLSASHAAAVLGDRIPNARFTDLP